MLSKETEVTKLNANLTELNYKLSMIEQNLESSRQMLDSKIKNEEILNSNIQKLNQDLCDSKDTLIKLNKELEWISNLNKEGKDEFNNLNQKLNKMKENEEFLQQRINNIEFDLTDSQKAEKSQRNLHLKDVMK